MITKSIARNFFVCCIATSALTGCVFNQTTVSQAPSDTHKKAETIEAKAIQPIEIAKGSQVSENQITPLIETQVAVPAKEKDGALVH